jgi:ribosome biogenesis GTPase A
MAKALGELEGLLGKTHVVLEVRDARLPFSSSNAVLDDMIKARKKPRIVVCNKADLVDQAFIARASAHFKKQGIACVWTTAVQFRTLKGLLPLIAANSKQKYKSIPSVCMVVGFPNTGKSTFINALRRMSAASNASESSGGRFANKLKKSKHKSAKTGPIPGVTRQVSGFMVSQDPLTYVMDTPGVMTPAKRMANDVEIGLRLALTGCIKENFVDPETLTMYLLWHLHTHHERAHGADVGPYNVGPLLHKQLTDTRGNDARTVLMKLAHVMGAATSVQGQPDFIRPAEHIFKVYRAGGLGKFALDTVPAS